MKSPREMTPKEWERHKTTHLPFHCACPHCVAGKKPNLQHRRSRTCRRIPHVCADYCYLRDSLSDTPITVLVVLVLPFRIYFATVVDAKGPDRTVVKRLGRLLRECGLTHYTYRSDREASLRSMLWAAAVEAGIPKDRVQDVRLTPDPEDSEQWVEG